MKFPSERKFGTVWICWQFILSFVHPRNLYTGQLSVSPCQCCCCYCSCLWCPIWQFFATSFSGFCGSGGLRELKLAPFRLIFIIFLDFIFPTECSAEMWRWDWVCVVCVPLCNHQASDFDHSIKIFYGQRGPLAPLASSFSPSLSICLSVCLSLSIRLTAALNKPWNRQTTPVELIDQSVAQIKR